MAGADDDRSLLLRRTREVQRHFLIPTCDRRSVDLDHRVEIQSIGDSAHPIPQWIAFWHVDIGHCTYALLEALSDVLGHVIN